MSSVIRSLVVKVGADTKQFQSEMKNISKDLGKAGKKISQAGKNMTMGVTLPAAAAGAAAFKMAADMEDAMGAADQIFGKSAENMKSWAKGLESYYGIATGEAVEYGNMMGSMLQNIGGLTEDEAASQAQTLIKLAGDLTAMYGGTTQDAVHALTGALKGNNTMLDNYGMAVNDSMIKTKALEMGLYDGTGQMDLATKQAATLALIMEQSGAAQGQAAREAEGASGSMRALMTEVKNLGTSIGTVLLPMITPIISKIKEMVEKFGSLDEGTKKNIVTFVALAAVVGPITSGIGGLVSGVGSAVGMFGKFSKAISGGSSVLSAMGGLIGPGGIVMLAVAAFAAAAFLIIKNWDKISGFFINLWDNIKTTFNNAVAWIKEFPDKMKQVGIDIVMGLWNGIKSYQEWIKSKVQGFVESIGSTIKNFFGIKSPSRLMQEYGENIDEGLAKGIENNANKPINAIQGIAEQVDSEINSIINKIKAFDNLSTEEKRESTNQYRKEQDNFYKNFKTEIDAISKNEDVDLGVAQAMFRHQIETGAYKLASGGIVTKPTLAMIGEAGPEAVVPLKKGYGNINITITGNNISSDYDINKIGEQLVNHLRRKGVMSLA